MNAVSHDDRIKSGGSDFFGSVNNLRDALGISEADLREVLALPLDKRYTEKTVKKKDGSDRRVYAPIASLKKIQNRVKTRILASPKFVSWPSYVYGSIRKQKTSSGIVDSRDYVSCAQKHSGAKSLLTVDIKDFFDNIHEDVVRDILERFVSRDAGVVRLLSDLCCHEGHLVQGAPTSSYLANMSMYDVEPILVKALNRKGLVYTRLVDDISISAKIFDYDFSFALKLLENSLMQKGLSLNASKVAIRSVGSAALTVHGLRVDYQSARLPAQEIGQIRAHVKNLESVAKAYKARTSYAYRKDFARCMGRVNKLARVGHKQHANYLKRLRAIQPLPSGNEAEHCLRRLERLERLFADRKGTFDFRKNYYRLQEKIYILSRSFPKAASKMKERMRKIYPPGRDR
ncbi:reverse transcriptase family protein [Achromobacter animicus]|uniref:reverse transcriptase family protein n=1 Tax=Achromobacter animicus TaxID=1389935 RepID=UPI0028AF9643|nr:reverse transcriptase family protein [Achromobacter animicus]